jgi:large subunit ribosomal protein L17
MRHLHAGRKLGRNSAHRLALLRNLARAVLEHERIITTVEKAKEARPFVEKLITLAKKGTLHARRLALQRLPDKEMVDKLFREYGPRFQDRAGGYTRIIKRHERRLGDAGRTAFLEILKAGETKFRARAPMPPPAPAPRLPQEPEAAPPAPEAATPPPAAPAAPEAAPPPPAASAATPPAQQPPTP